MKKENIPDLSVMKVLFTAASSGNMVAAASRLGVKAEAVRARIKSLERRTKKKLLTRTTRRCQITNEGRLLLEGYAKSLRDELEATEQFLQPKEKKPEPLKKPGARFDVALRCTEDGQWVAFNEAPGVVIAHADLGEVLLKLAQELTKHLTAPTEEK